MRRAGRDPDDLRQAHDDTPRRARDCRLRRRPRSSNQDVTLSSVSLNWLSIQLHPLALTLPSARALRSFPSPTLSTALLPTHLYIFSSLLLPFLTSPDHARRISHLETIRELAAFVARRQWRHKGQQSLSPSPASREDGLALGRSTTQKPFAPNPVRAAAAPLSPEPTWPHTGANTPALGRTPGLGSRAYDSEWQWSEAGSKPRLASRAGMGGCRLVIWREKDGWAARGNTVAGWVELNRAALRLVPAGPPPAYTPSGVFISPDSHLHASVYANLGEKVGVKRCIIGKGCFVGKGTKLTNCVVMEGVVIGDKSVDLLGRVPDTQGLMRSFFGVQGCAG